MTARIEDIRLELPHVELAAHLYGPAEGRPVIALHGWLDNAASFSRLAPHLQGLRIVALDLPGHGHSGHRPAGAGYLLWDYAYDVLAVAEQLGWRRFSLLGHSLGAIIAVLFAAAMPQRVERLALIDGLFPPTGEAPEAPRKLGEALQGHLDLPSKTKPVYASVDEAVRARMNGVNRVSQEAAERLAARGLMPVSGGYTWRSDPRLRLASPLRLTEAQALAFARAVQCPVDVVVAEDGLLHARKMVMKALGELPFQLHRLPGGHHLHLDDAAGALAVAECFNRAFAAP
jgi:pimeloyl-ACP methyl ester carboxylesterase